MLEAFESVKRPVSITFVIDTSGSMNGEPLQQAKAGARVFLERLPDGDTARVMFFSSAPRWRVGAAGAARRLAAAPHPGHRGAASPSGGTALYDALLRPSRPHRARSKGAARAVVVLTDGEDTDSKVKLDRAPGACSGSSASEESAPGQEPPRVFTIAYGDKADPGALKRIAEAGGGAFFSGTPKDIQCRVRGAGDVLLRGETWHDDRDQAGRLLMFVSGLVAARATPRTATGCSGGFVRATPGASAAPVRTGATVKLTVLYGTEKEQWLKAAVEEFAQKQPEIEVDLKGHGHDRLRARDRGGTREARGLVARGRDRAQPARPRVVAAARARPSSSAPATSLPSPLVLTPLVMIAWEERAKVLAAAAKGASHRLGGHPRARHRTRAAGWAWAAPPSGAS